MKKILFILALMVGVSYCEAKPLIRLNLKSLKTLFKKKSPLASYKDAKAVENAFALLYNQYDQPEYKKSRGGDYHPADTIAKEISAHFYRDPKMQMALARAYYANHERTKMRVYINKALALDKTHGPAYVLLGDCFLEPEKDKNRGTYVPVEAKDSACAYYEMAMRMNPKYAVAYERCATALARARQLDAAKGVLEQLHAVNSSYPYEAFYAGLVTLYDPNNMEAKKNAIMSTDPYKLSLVDLNNYAGELNVSGDYDNAVKFAKIGYERFPGPYRKYFCETILKAAAFKGDYKTAIEYGKQFIDQTSKDSISSVDYYSMGASEIALGNIDEGFEYFSHISETHDEFTNQMDGKIRNLMSIQVKEKQVVKDYDGAISMYIKYIEKYPSKIDPAYQIYTLGTLYQARLKVDETYEDSIADIKNTLKYYGEVIAKYPDWGNVGAVYFNYANLTSRYIDPHNMRGEAIPYYQKYYEMVDQKADPSDSEKNLASVAAYSIAFYYWKVKNDNRNGYIWFSNVLKYDPTDEQSKQIVALLAPKKSSKRKSR